MAELNEELIKAYEEAGLSLLDIIRSLEDGIGKRRQLLLFKRIDEIIIQLTAESATKMKDILSEEYKQGSREAIQQLDSQGVKEIDTSLRPIIHQNAVQEIMNDSFYSILEATENMGVDAKRRIEEATRKANQGSLIEGVSRRQATQDAVAELTEQQIIGIIAKNGAMIPIQAYMANVIQYNQRKAHVQGALNRIKENNMDLVYVNEVGITCEYCAMYQGRVYSISGNDPRFPKLDVEPPYHSHCVHSLSAWVEDYQDSDEKSRMVTLSNRPFRDNRTQKNIRAYERIQKEKSKRNITRKQWIRYKARMPDLPSLRTFASHKARDTEKYREWLSNFREIGFEIKERGG